MPHGPLVPPLAAHGHLAFTLSELVEWGERFGRVATAPLVVTVSGELGAGKTTLVQAICRGYGVADDVTSPTFALVHRYEGRRSPVYHLDLYRLERQDDLTNIASAHIVTGHAVRLGEWAQGAGAGRSA